jgi:hypothetical protein
MAEAMAGHVDRDPQHRCRVRTRGRITPPS